VRAAATPAQVKIPESYGPRHGNPEGSSPPTPPDDNKSPSCVLVTTSSMLHMRAAIVAVLLTLGSQTNAQTLNAWHRASGFDGGVSRAFVADTSSVYSLGNDGVFESDDVGATWHRVNTANFPGPVGSIALYEGRLYASGEVLAWTSDLGRTWTVDTANLHARTARLSSSNGELFATTALGVYRRGDLNELWQQISDMQYASDASSDSQYFYVMKRCGGLYRRPRSVTEWAHIGVARDTSQCGGRVGVAGGTLFEILPNSELYASSQGGPRYWYKELNGVNDLPIRVGGTWYAATSSGLMSLIDDGSGTPWRRVYSFTRAPTRLTVAKNFMLTSAGTVLRSNDSGRSWSNVTKGYSDCLTFGFARYKDRLLVKKNQVPFESWDRGATWSEATELGRYTTATSRYLFYLQTIIQDTVEYTLISRFSEDSAKATQLVWPVLQRAR
jgi:photosystem II stability/assembly factor-like uncharacterized protein